VLVDDPVGGKLVAPVRVAAGLASLSLWPFSERGFVLHVTEPGDIMLDVGAYIGSFTVPMAIQGATVHAFEPVSSSREILARNLRLNQIEHLVTIHGVAVSDTSCRAAITTEYASGNRLTTSEDTAATVPVSVVTLDAWASGRNLDRLLLMKVDAEGSDERVLAGAIGLLHRYQPALIVEYWDGSARLQAWLRSAGYQTYGYDMRTGELVASVAATGLSGNVIACTPARYDTLSTRLATRPPVQLVRPRIMWAPPEVA